MGNNRQPISVARDNFVSTLTAVINSCGLPPFMIEDILKWMYLEARQVSQRQVASDRRNYEAMLNEDNSGGNTSPNE